MSMSSGSRSRRLSSPTGEMKKAGRYMTRQNLPTIPKGKKKLPSTASHNWTKTASKKSESVKAKVRNISGRRSQYRRTIGTITARLRSGDHLGRNTVTGILQKTSRSITEAMHGRGEIRFRLSTKALLQDRWKRKGRLPTDARSTERSGNGILSNNRSEK